MLELSKFEARVVAVFVIVVLVGSGLNVLSKRYPHVWRLTELVDGDRLYPTQDVNTATVQELIQIPYIGNYTAHAIVELREQRGVIVDLEQLKTIPGIRDGNFQRFAPYLKVRRSR